MENWFSIVPFVIAVFVAMTTRQVLVGLGLGLLIGSYSLKPGIFNSLSKMSDYVFIAISDRDNLRIIIFLFVFGGLVGMMQVAGGIKGFAKTVQKRIKTERSALIVAWSTILVTFMDCEFRIMTTGPVMKAAKTSVAITRAKLAYAIDVSTVPVIVLMPVATTYTGYMVSVVGGSLNQLNINRSPYQLFLASIPFNFWALSIVTIGIFAVLTGRYIGKGIDSNNGHNVSEIEEEIHRESIESELEKVEPKAMNLILPLLLLLSSTFYLIWQDGLHKGANSFLDAMQQADATQAMLIALFATVIFSLCLFLLRKEKISELMFHFIDGGNQIIMAIILLVLVWALANMAEDLGFSSFITGTAGTFLSGAFVPVAVFLFGSLIAYFIGSSWGTWGLLMPLAISLAEATDASLPLAVAAVFAAGSFGDFTSPLGETTVTTASVFDLPVVDYAKAKSASSFVALGVSTILFVIAGLFF
ncbi:MULTISPECIES: Na+/H+ antiporter NhaC family protein [Niallia]|uniref:Sodium:proton antiporter n=2 Tax=Bacteria TaxID=2 RepID=A0A3S2U868_9BACI|nr:MULTISPECIES: Na+/H+ antiporter NhaC family protein [Niallia]MED4038275.1 Na+/H+ antiporter NhaC family protein [Niallia taxi]MED4056623.1 Na+/H+ antiporter NhaC family protein [Niallia taxi]MED4120642.1 Na+/H+ antiporter NhaC family protein [Niallia taxi]RVT59431.1 sodium:proton antiporter [Niallia taxi]UPO91183.1 sodium:proton antiporter [Niallia sp. Man26]